MKKLLLLLPLAICHLPLQARPVMFPLAQMFGGAEYARQFTLTAEYPETTDATNIYIGTFETVTPTGGTNPIVQLEPNNYLLTFSDARAPLRFPVPFGNSLLNVLNLITNGLMTFTNWSPAGSAVQPGWSGTITNLAPASLATNGLLLAGCPTNSANTVYYPTAGSSSGGNWTYGNFYVAANGDYAASISDSDGIEQWGLWITNTASGGFYAPFLVNDNVTTRPQTETWWYTVNVLSAGTFVWADNIVSIPHFNIEQFTNGTCTTNIVQ
jgi:hypothetical protein